VGYALLKKLMIFLPPLLFLGCNRHKDSGDARDLAEAANGRAIKSYKAAEFKQAVDELDDAIRLDPTKAAYYFNRANSKALLHDLEGAIKDFDRAIEIDPGAATYYSSRGYAFYKLGKFDKAIQEQLEAIRLEPMNSNGYYNLARIYGVWDGKQNWYYR
jgi:tetratricopeptide (TPR) repeat protein